MNDQVRTFLDELKEIKRVWKSFVVALVIAGAMIWVALNWRYGAAIDRRNEQLASKDELIGKLEERVKVSEEKASKATEFSLELTPINNCRYTNQTVEIDGKLFVDCVFNNVTFSYVGKGDYSFMRASFLGTINVDTDYQPARVYFRLINNLASMARRGNFSFGYREVEGGPLIPYKEPTMNDPKP